MCHHTLEAKPLNFVNNTGRTISLNVMVIGFSPMMVFQHHVTIFPHSAPSKIYFHYLSSALRLMLLSKFFKN